MLTFGALHFVGVQNILFQTLGNTHSRSSVFNSIQFYSAISISKRNIAAEVTDFFVSDIKKSMKGIGALQLHRGHHPIDVDM
jgi:hypothetical protein